MKTEKISINKTPQQPDGIEVEVVIPENDLEQGALCFLLVGFLRDLKRENRIPYDLPERFRVEHRGRGTFVAFAFDPNVTYYEPPKPIAILGLRHLGGRFDLIHAAPALRPTAPQQQPPAQPEAQADQPAPPADAGSAT